MAQATMDVGSIVLNETAHHMQKSSTGAESVTAILATKAANLKAKHQQNLEERSKVVTAEQTPEII